MKKQDIRNIYTQTVTELLNQGDTIFPDTMSGHQGEIAHIDLSNGSEILRVLLCRGHHWERGEENWPVHMSDGSEISGMIYLMNMIRQSPPTEGYYKGIENAYRRLGLRSQISTVLKPALERSLRRGTHW